MNKIDPATAKAIQTLGKGILQLAAREAVIKEAKEKLRAQLEPLVRRATETKADKREPVEIKDGDELLGTATIGSTRSVSIKEASRATLGKVFTTRQLAEMAKPDMAMVDAITKAFVEKPERLKEILAVLDIGSSDVLRCEQKRNMSPLALSEAAAQETAALAEVEGLAQLLKQSDDAARADDDDATTKKTPVPVSAPKVKAVKKTPAKV